MIWSTSILIVCGCVMYSIWRLGRDLDIRREAELNALRSRQNSLGFEHAAQLLITCSQNPALKERMQSQGYYQEALNTIQAKLDFRADLP